MWPWEQASNCGAEGTRQTGHVLKVGCTRYVFGFAQEPVRKDNVRTLTASARKEKPAQGRLREKRMVRPYFDDVTKEWVIAWTESAMRF